MTNEITFATNSLFENVTFNRNAASWVFSFSNNICVGASGFWRLLRNNKVAFVSLDNGHQFSLPKPFDLVEEVNKELDSKHLIKIEVFNDTSDQVLTFTKGCKLEIYIASTGYETYDFLYRRQKIYRFRFW